LARWSRLRGLNTRIVRGVPAAKLRCVPLNELRALRRLRRGTGDALRTLHERNEKFQDTIPERALRESDAIIGFDTSGWLLARRAQTLGRPFFLDRTIAHPAAFARIEAELHRRYPAWCPDAKPRPDYLAAAEAEEHQRAHRIVVGSAFARDTLLAEGIAPEKVRVNPYGVDWSRFAAPPEASTAREAARPLRFLYLGSLLARKGVPVLLDAWRAFGARRGDAELWLAGHCGEHERRLIPELPGLRLLGLVPRAEVPRLFAQIDVFVLPSFFEGFSLVLLEALAAGVPVISTPNAGALDLGLGASYGRIVPAGSVEALTAAFEDYRAAPPDRASVRAATTLIARDFSWEAYGDRWAALLRET